jgi:hypothetical protein
MGDLDFTFKRKLNDMGTGVSSPSIDPGVRKAST